MPEIVLRSDIIIVCGGGGRGNKESVIRIINYTNGLNLRTEDEKKKSKHYEMNRRQGH